MVSVTCSCVDCIYNGRNNKCKADKIKLTYRNMATVNEGRVDMWVCDKNTLPESEEKIVERIVAMMKRR